MPNNVLFDLKRKVIPFLLIFCLIASFPGLCASETYREISTISRAINVSPISVDRVKEKFDKSITGFLHAKGFPGAVVSIHKGGELILNESYGACRDAAEVFPIASVSKLFTEVAIKRLIAEDVLSEDLKAIEFLKLDYPVLDKRVNNVTIKQLLDHTGGWDRDITDDPLFSFDQLPYEINTNEEFLKYVLTNLHLDHDPGKVEAYSNFGYFLLGMIIEKATGQKYLDFVNEELAGPNQIELFQAATPREFTAEYPFPKLFKLELATASFGISARIPDIGYFFSQYDREGFSKSNSEENEKEWWKDGSLPGIVTSLVRQRLNDVVIVVFIPARDENSWMEDNELLYKLVDATAKAVGL